MFLCHGDSYRVKYGLDMLEKKAKEVRADIVIFGHTHVPLNIKKDNILYINPGSLSLPRDLSRRGFIIININNRADIVIFGHTHVPLNIKKDNILYINPGSLSLPRDLSRRGFIIININNNDIIIEDINI